jgi:hypothetical protein
LVSQQAASTAATTAAVPANKVASSASDAHTAPTTSSSISTITAKSSSAVVNANVVAAKSRPNVSIVAVSTAALAGAVYLFASRNAGDSSSGVLHSNTRYSTDKQSSSSSSSSRDDHGEHDDSSDTDDKPHVTVPLCWRSMSVEP